MPPLYTLFFQPRDKQLLKRKDMPLSILKATATKFAVAFFLKSAIVASQKVIEMSHAFLLIEIDMK
jgi:hypothetical protein